MFDNTLGQPYELRLLVFDDFLQSLMLTISVSDSRIIIVEHKVLDL